MILNSMAARFYVLKFKSTQDDVKENTNIWEGEHRGLWVRISTKSIASYSFRLAQFNTVMLSVKRNRKKKQVIYTPRNSFRSCQNSSELRGNQRHIKGLLDDNLHRRRWCQSEKKPYLYNGLAQTQKAKAKRNVRKCSVTHYHRMIPAKVRVSTTENKVKGGKKKYKSKAFWSPSFSLNIMSFSLQYLGNVAATIYIWSCNCSITQHIARRDLWAKVELG